MAQDLKLPTDFAADTPVVNNFNKFRLAGACPRGYNHGNQKFIKPLKWTVLTLIALSGIIVPTHAQVVVFNSFGAGDTYNSGRGCPR